MHIAVRSVQILVLVALLVFAIAVPVRAEEGPRKEAREHYERGLELANRGAYEPALREFRLAYEKSPQFAVLYNIGQAEIAIGHPVEAIDALSQYLRDGKELVPAGRREQVERQITLVKSLLAEISITSEPPGAVIAIDGRELGRTPLEEPVKVAHGSHEIVATFERYGPLRQTVALSEGEQRVVRFELPPPRPPAVETVVRPPVCPAPSAAPPPKPAQKPERRAAPLVGYALVATGALLEVGAVAHYFWNRGRYEDWQAEDAELQSRRSASDYEQRQLANNELAASIESASAVTVGLAVAGGVAAAGGAVLIWTGAQQGSSAGVSVGPQGVAYRGVF